MAQLTYAVMTQGTKSRWLWSRRCVRLRKSGQVTLIRSGKLVPGNYAFRERGAAVRTYGVGLAAACSPERAAALLSEATASSSKAAKIAAARRQPSAPTTRAHACAQVRPRRARQWVGSRPDNCVRPVAWYFDDGWPVPVSRRTIDRLFSVLKRVRLPMR